MKFSRVGCRKFLVGLRNYHGRGLRDIWIDVRVFGSPCWEIRKKPSKNSQKYRGGNETAN